MFTTNAFDYTNILDKAADASWMRENVITNNIAISTHLDTRDRMLILNLYYKRHSVRQNTAALIRR